MVEIKTKSIPNTKDKKVKVIPDDYPTKYFKSQFEKW
jgi:hypothetical protein